MAERRMFAKKIVTSDAFLDMPATARCLYFTLGMFADDDGFVNSPKSIMRQVGASQDDMNILIAKKFILIFESGVIVIKHWRLHNYIKADRYKPTTYQEEKAMLGYDENNAYTQNVGISTMYPKCIHDDSDSDTQDRLGKDRLGKNINTIKDSIRTPDGIPTAFKTIVEAWNELPLRDVKRISEGSKRYTLLKARIKEAGTDEVVKAIDSIKNSSFLLGQNKTGWTITFDWFIKPGNFAKVLEGNYEDKVESAIDESWKEEFRNE